MGLILSVQGDKTELHLRSVNVRKTVTLVESLMLRNNINKAPWAITEDIYAFFGHFMNLKKMSMQICRDVTVSHAVPAYYRLFDQ